ncbi:MAG: GGDEF domain-containing protein [Campylobacterota bacterium]|nr:GGDEF domain-containing protein [Campylobacterota bacterium]
MQIQDKNRDEILTFSKQKTTLQELIVKEEFVSIVDLIDPTTSLKIGKMTLVYSKNSYKKYMQDFYIWLFYAVLCFIVAIIFVAYSLFNSLKNLNILASSLENFNPHKPKKLPLKTDSKDEVSSISHSANIMVDNLIQYITYTKELNSKLSLNQNHLKEAQRIANVGSWQYDVVNDKLELSDEIYRIMGIKQNKNIKWDDYLSFIAEKDYDYILKVLNRAVKNGSNFDLKYSIQIENRPQIEIKTRGKVRKKSDGSTKITAVSLDITQESKNKKIIEKLAYYDSLTKLPNRTLLKDRIHKALQNAKREKTKIAILFLDLDHFKLINDTLGHGIGDELLIYIANLLKTQVRESDTVSRIGGDEFVILLPSFNSIEDVEVISNKLVQSLQGQHNIDSHQLYITTSMGISIYPDHIHL